MSPKQILILSAPGCLLLSALSALVGLPGPLAAALGAILALPLPLFALQQQARLRKQIAEETAHTLMRSPQALLLLDGEGHLLALSQGLQKLAGMSANKDLDSLCALPSGWQNLIAELHHLALSQGSASQQLRADAESLHRPFEVSALKLPGADGREQILLCWTPLDAHETPPAGASEPDLLERSRSFVQTLIDVIPQPVYIKQMHAGESRYTLVNEAFCASHHRPREALIGCRPQDLFEPLQANAMLQEDRAVLEGSSVFREEKGLDSASGRERYLIISKQSCLSPEGERVIVGTQFDITPWRTAEHELQQTLKRERNLRERTQSFIQRIIDVIPYPVHVKDAQCRYLIVNDAFVRERGCSREALLGRDPAGVVELMTEGRDAARATENQRARLSLEEDRQVLAGHTLTKEEHNRHSVSGEERFRTVFKCSCLDTEGQPAIVTAMFDITKWRLAERELQEALAREKNLRERTQDFLQRFIDVIPQPVYMKNVESRYLMINEAFARELRRKREDIVGHTSFELAPTPEIATDSALEDEAVLAGEVVFKEKKDLPYPGSPPRDRIISKRLCFDVDGQPVVVGNHVDIGALRSAERELQAAMSREQARNLRMQAYLQRIIDVIPQEFYIKDSASRILMVNRAFLLQRNLHSAAEAIGRTMDELAILIYSNDPAYRDKPDAIAEAVAYYKSRVAQSHAEDRDVLAGRAVLKEEHRKMRLSGEEHYFLIAKEACLDVDDQPVIVCANFDITALRLAERALQHAQGAAADE